MGRATRHMTKQFKHSSKRQGGGFNKFGSNQRRERREDTREHAEPKEKNLQLINLTEEQEKTNKLKFVYELPESLKAIKALLKDQSEENQLIIIQRIRDYHNPDLVQTVEHQAKFDYFVTSLLKYYLKTSISDKGSPLLTHLKELCSRCGHVFASFLKQKLVKVVKSLTLLKEKREGSSLTVFLENEENYIQELLDDLLKVQRVFIEVLQTPENSKFLELIEHTCGQLYSLSGTLLKENILKIIEVLEKDLKICSSIKKKFNPSVTGMILRLALYLSKQKKKDSTMIKHFAKVYSQYISLIKQTLSAQLQIQEINKVIRESDLFVLPQGSQVASIEDFSSSPLTLLLLEDKKPKALATFAPLIEDEFLLFKDQKALKRLKGPDEKELKRKMKKTENHAIRELRKDTTVIQQQRDKEAKFKRDQFSKTVVRAGAIKDEI